MTSIQHKILLSIVIIILMLLIYFCYIIYQTPPSLAYLGIFLGSGIMIIIGIITQVYIFKARLPVKRIFIALTLFAVILSLPLLISEYVGNNILQYFGKGASMIALSVHLLAMVWIWIIQNRKFSATKT